MRQGFQFKHLLAKSGRVRFQVTAAVIFLILLFLFANQGFKKMINNRQELKRLEAEIQKLQQQQELLIKELALAKHDLPYLERVARKELGLIQPGEIEYRFIEEEKK